MGERRPNSPLYLPRLPHCLGLSPSYRLWQSPLTSGECLPMTKQFFIVGMRSNPEPQDITFVFHGHRSVVDADTDRPETTDLLEMQRGMTWILAQQRIAPVGKALDICWQVTIVGPKTWGRSVSHRSVHRPSRRAWIASCARESSRPAATSSSNC
jgi:hypothetical protein